MHVAVPLTRKEHTLMAKSTAITVVGKSDRASQASTALVIEALREASGNSEFFNFTESSARARPVADTAALLNLVSRERADIAVIEAGELPLKFGRKLEIGAVLKRGNPFNVMVIDGEMIFEDLPADTAIAVRNAAVKGQLLNYRGDIDFVDSVEDYAGLKKMMELNEIGGFIARAWEVEMLGRQDEVTEVFTSSICMPPAGQGAVILVIRAGNKKAAEEVRRINDPPSFTEVILERTLLGAVSKDGRDGVGVLAEFEEDEFDLGAVVAAPDGSVKIASEMHGWIGDELKVVGSIVDDLFERGCGEIMEMYRNIPEE
jgi:hydroxymethylbilane synthase